MEAIIGLVPGIAIQSTEGVQRPARMLMSVGLHSHAVSRDCAKDMEQHLENVGVCGPKVVA